MRAAWYERKGAAAAVLTVGERPTPEPGPAELLIRVRASGVNPSDTKARGGFRGNMGMPFPVIIPHQDGSGEVVAAGSPELAHRVGQRVWFYEAQFERPFGAAAEYTAIPARKAVQMPASLSFEEGACLGVPAMTAHRAVFADGPVKDKTVFVSGGAGAVGRYAVQFAKHGGARVIASVGSARGAASAKAAGADLILDRRNDDLIGGTAEFTGARDGRGVDRFVEVAFGANLPLIERLLKPNGVVATYSSDSVPDPKLPFWPLLMLDATIRLILVYRMDASAHIAAEHAINEALVSGALTHDIARVFDLEHIALAHELVEKGPGGKVIVRP
jgi:NADPH2:quinone reductase